MRIKSNRFFKSDVNGVEVLLAESPEVKEQIKKHTNAIANRDVVFEQTIVPNEHIIVGPQGVGRCSYMNEFNSNDIKDVKILKTERK